MRRPSKKRIVCLLCVPLLLSGCQKYYLSLTDQKIDVNYLASTHVGTPDKRQHNPPIGEMIVMDWRIPKDILKQSPVIDLHVIYGNYTEKTLHYPLKKRMGYVTYKDLNEEFASTKGIITYSADIRLEDGTIFRSWKHQLWANLITVDEEPAQTTSSASDGSAKEDELVADNSEEESESESEEDSSEGAGEDLDPSEENDDEPEEEPEEDESHFDAESISSSVEGQSMQGSVNDTDDLMDETFSEMN